MTSATAYYNEIDPFAAEWLRQLIDAGHIAPGKVDERSIEDVTPADLRGFTQCHFFAGIGVWSYALRQAGWSDDRPVWTGSCPCQPFSAAGQGKGFDDERHLWPTFHWLISQCRPDRIFGEQVAGKAGESWLDLVSTDLEAADYACGAVTFPACSVGAPHQRQRLYWMADDDRQGRQLIGTARIHDQGQPRNDAAGCGSDDDLAHADNTGPQGRPGMPECTHQQPAGQGSLDDDHRRPGPTNGYWSDADWLFCRDERWRPVEPSTFPLVDGSPARVGRLRGYGNAIVAEQAKIFIETVGIDNVPGHR